MIEACARTGTMLEINGSVDRRDLNDVHARAAAEAGVWIIVTTDAHRVRTLVEHAPLRDRDRAARVADGRAGGKHASVAGVRHVAQAAAQR